MHPRIAMAITRKDFFDALRNMYLLFALILPVGMSVVFRVIFPSDDSGSGIGSVDVAVYDFTGGQSKLVKVMQDTGQVSFFFVATPEAVKEAVQKERTAGMVIPDGFDASLAAGQTPDLQTYVNSGRGTVKVAVFHEMLEHGLRSLDAQPLPANIVVTEAGSSESSGMNIASFYLTLFLVMGLTMVGVFVVPYILVEEKEKGTLKAILVSPATYSDVVMGKGGMGLTYALVSAISLLILNNGLTGQVMVTLMTVLLGAIFLVQVGLLMGAAFKTVTQVNSWSSIVLLVLLMPAMFGEFLRPPDPLPTLMAFIPTTYLARGVTQAIAGTATPSSILVNLGVLAMCSLAAFVAVVWFLKRERL